MSNVSVIYLVKDPPIARLCAQVEYLRAVADQFVFVVDDRTMQDDVDIISSWPGAVIQPFTWCDDFAAARNAALPHVTRPWTLHLDPDELPTWQMLSHISTVTASSAPANPVAWTYFTPNWWGGVKGPVEPCHWHVRLWQSGRGHFYRALHELVMLDGHPESATRGNLALPAPEDAYLIHSKGGETIRASDELYARLMVKAGL